MVNLLFWMCFLAGFLFAKMRINTEELSLKEIHRGLLITIIWWGIGHWVLSDSELNKLVIKPFVTEKTMDTLHWAGLYVYGSFMGGMILSHIIALFTNEDRPPQKRDQ